MKTVIIGGTFNPVHTGHLFLAEEVRKNLKYERVIFVPSHIPAHKETEDSTSPQQRLEMLRCAVRDSDFVIDNCEIRRGGISYTIDTVDELHEYYDITGRPGLVIGDDLVEGFHEWKNWEELLTKIDLIIAHRSFRKKVFCSVDHIYVDNLILPISSSEVRRRVREGKAFRYILPEAVYNYITEHGIYMEKRKEI